MGREERKGEGGEGREKTRRGGKRWEDRTREAGEGIEESILRGEKHANFTDS